MSRTAVAQGRASTSLASTSKKDVDGRDKPGHEEIRFMFRQFRHSICARRRKWMRSRRFESEAPRLFGSRDLLEGVHTKNVIEPSVLRREGGARSAEEYELTRNASRD
jgi:hypothetical protein